MKEPKEITLDIAGNLKQHQAVGLWINKTTTDIVYGGSKGSGKSYLGCSLIFGDALIYPETSYFIARKHLNDLRKYTNPSIQEVFKDWGLSKDYYTYNGQDNYYKLHNGSMVYLIDAKYVPSDPLYYRFGSMQMTRGWIEEAGEFEVEAKNNLAASIGRWKNDQYGLTAKLLQTCNPSKNYLYSDYYKPFKEGKLEPWKAFIPALPHDNKKLSKGYLENLLNVLSPNEKERLVYGNWEYEDDPLKLFSDYNKILELFTNEFIRPQGEKYLTADIAYEGSDLFVIGIWHGMVLEQIIAIDKIDETLVSKKIHELRLQYSIPLTNVVYDADGLKTFVKQSASSGNLNGATQFHNGGRPFNNEKYFNLKAQCYFKLADKVKKNEIFIRSKEYRKQIIEDFEQIKKKQRNDDNEPHRLESKEDLKERLRRSPDFSDCFIAGTKILTPTGNKNIENLKEGDLVVTPFGNRRILKTIHRKSKVIHNINNEIYATGNHRFVTKKGLISADNIKQNNYIYKLSLRDIWLWRLKILLNIMDGSIGFRKQILNTIMLTSSQMEEERKLDFISKYILTTSEPSPQNTTFTTLMETVSITMLIIWLRLKEVFIGATTKNNAWKTQNTGRQLSKCLGVIIKRLLTGISQKKEKFGIATTPNPIGQKGSFTQSNVNIAEISLKQPFQKEPSFVRTLAIKTIGMLKRKILKKEPAPFVYQGLKLEEMRKPKRVQGNVLVNYDQEIDVYTLTVEKDHVYYANGYLVENCIMMRMYFELAPKRQYITVYN